jgi:hypothetical protein
MSSTPLFDNVTGISRDGCLAQAHISLKVRGADAWHGKCFRR